MLVVRISTWSSSALGTWIPSGDAHPLSSTAGIVSCDRTRQIGSRFRSVLPGLTCMNGLVIRVPTVFKRVCLYFRRSSVATMPMSTLRHINKGSRIVARCGECDFEFALDWIGEPDVEVDPLELLDDEDVPEELIVTVAVLVPEVNDAVLVPEVNDAWLSPTVETIEIGSVKLELVSGTGIFNKGREGPWSPEPLLGNRVGPCSPSMLMLIKSTEPEPEPEGDMSLIETPVSMKASRSLDEIMEFPWCSPLTESTST